MTLVPNRVEFRLRQTRAEISSILTANPGATTAQVNQIRGKKLALTRNSLLSMMYAGLITKQGDGWVLLEGKR